MRRVIGRLIMLPLIATFLPGAAAPPTDCAVDPAHGAYSSTTAPAFRPNDMMDVAGNAPLPPSGRVGEATCVATEAGNMGNNRAWNTSADVLHGLPVLDLLQLPTGKSPGVDPN